MTPYHQDDWLTVWQGDCVEVMAQMEPESVHCVVTSPPYWGLRDYGVSGALGLEPTPEEFVANMVAVFREVRRVLRADGTCWVNLGDSYASTAPGTRNSPALLTGSGAAERARMRPETPDGLKPKDLVGIPWRVAFALQADGWYLRSAITWCKANPMPESVTDRPTNATEMVFLFSKSARYFYDADAVREVAKYQPGDRADVDRGGFGGKWAGEPGKEAFRSISGGRNMRNYWLLPTQPYGSVRVQRVGDGGTDRRVSRDCPVHGDRDHQESTAGRDGRPDASGSDRSPRTDPHPELGLLAALSPTDSRLAEDSLLGSSGSPSLEYGEPATPHSSGTRRTARVASTSQRETDADTSGSRTERTSPHGVPDAIGDRIHESNTEAGFGGGDSDSGPSVGTPDRSACTCAYWESVSHFAVFPEKLVEPCVKAGTSERGVCPECGSPWRRVVEKKLVQRATIGRTDRFEETGARPHPGQRRTGNGSSVMGHYEIDTRNWLPSCSCTGLGVEYGSDGAVPATVLDPFAGSGTTGRVAQRLGRRAVLIDLSADYLVQAMKRNTEIPLGLESA